MSAIVVSVFESSSMNLPMVTVRKSSQTVSSMTHTGVIIARFLYSLSYLSSLNMGGYHTPFFQTE